MNRKIIFTENAPGAIGYYSQAIVSNGLVYTAGQIPLDPKTGELISNDFTEQVKQTLNNIESVLKATGTDLNKSIKLTVFITNLSNYPELNTVFKEWFDGVDPPARSVVEVSALPKGVQIEIDCIATL
ncbi:MAG: Rid family detoxifying hydrolase [Candidatus Marinimicrobia bacterium]|jgi:2-iminobutanoate/2-iminopropanoate deaminase|nr:Rid family detoxifying hydrolase [Candidatus Neomarinimicrobiota bacterium]